MNKDDVNNDCLQQEGIEVLSPTGMYLSSHYKSCLC